MSIATLLPLLLTGCKGCIENGLILHPVDSDVPNPEDTGTNGGGNVDSDSDSTDEEPELGPCSDGSWGPLTADPQGSYFLVSPNGNDSIGNGSRDNPYKTISYALAAGPGDGIFVDPGEYNETLEITSNMSGKSLVSCGGSEVTSIITDRSTFAMIEVSSADDFLLRGFTIFSNANFAALVVDGGFADVSDIHIYGEGNGMGIASINSSDDSENFFDDITIDSISYTQEEFINAGIYISESTTNISNATIDNIRDIGILVYGESTIAHIERTTQINSTGFFGIHFDGGQGSVSGEINDAKIAGLLVEGSPSIIVNDLSINGVYEITDPNQNDEDIRQIADGIIISTPDSALNSNPEDSQIELKNISISDTDRAGIIVDNATVNTLENITTINVGHQSERGLSVFFQHGTLVDSNISTDLYEMLVDPSSWIPIPLVE